MDRLALCEKHPAECGALRAEFGGEPNVSVHEIDGYVAVRAMLPPSERRALVLIDPPFEVQDEFALIGQALWNGKLTIQKQRAHFAQPLKSKGRGAQPIRTA